MILFMNFKCFSMVSPIGNRKREIPFCVGISFNLTFTWNKWIVFISWIVECFYDWQQWIRGKKTIEEKRKFCTHTLTHTIYGWTVSVMRKTWHFWISKRNKSQIDKTLSFVWRVNGHIRMLNCQKTMASTHFTWKWFCAKRTVTPREREQK